MHNTTSPSRATSMIVCGMAAMSSTKTGSTLASNWQAQGQVLRAVRAEGEARAAQYDYAAAVDRFKAGQALAAQSGTPADYVEVSIIDTRLRAVQLLLREQTAER